MSSFLGRIVRSKSPSCCLASMPCSTVTGLGGTLNSGGLKTQFGFASVFRKRKYLNLRYEPSKRYHFVFSTLKRTCPLGSAPQPVVVTSALSTNPPPFFAR